MSAKAEQKERTRNRILDAAAGAMRVHGSQGVAVAALMKQAGLTHGGFYAHFASRDDLVAHAVDRMFDDSRAMLERAFGDTPDAAGLSRLIDYYLSETALHRIDRGCPLPSLLGESVRMPQAARSRFEAGVAGFRSRIAQALAAMGEPDPQSLAGSVLAELVGAMTMARAQSDATAASSLLAASRAALKARLGLT